MLWSLKVLHPDTKEILHEEDNIKNGQLCFEILMNVLKENDLPLQYTFNKRHFIQCSSHYVKEHPSRYKIKKFCEFIIINKKYNKPTRKKKNESSDSDERSSEEDA